MQKVILKAEKRMEIGKGGARDLRRQGMLPAVLYAKGVSTPIKLQKKEVAKLIVSGGGEHTLVTIKLSSDEDKKKDHWALIKDYQLDPVKNELLHVDFLEISLKKKIKITAPIVITEEPIGIKKGGILQQQLREVEIECFPIQIPDGIEVDASSVNIGHSLHVGDLITREGVKILTDPHDVVLTVSAPIVVEEVVAPVEEEITEPELVKKAKLEEEEAAAEEEQKGQKAQKGEKDQKEK